MKTVLWKIKHIEKVRTKENVLLAIYSFCWKNFSLCMEIYMKDGVVKVLGSNLAAAIFLCALGQTLNPNCLSTQACGVGTSDYLLGSKMKARGAEL